MTTNTEMLTSASRDMMINSEKRVFLLFFDIWVYRQVIKMINKTPRAIELADFSRMDWKKVDLVE